MSRPYISRTVPFQSEPNGREQAPLKPAQIGSAVLLSPPPFLFHLGSALPSVPIEPCRGMIMVLQTRFGCKRLRIYPNRLCHRTKCCETPTWRGCASPPGHMRGTNTSQSYSKKETCLCSLRVPGADNLPEIGANPAPEATMGSTALPILFAPSARRQSASAASVAYPGGSRRETTNLLTCTFKT